MMRSSKWDEKSIENQLRELPKIEDKQSKEELFKLIQDRLQEEQIIERPKKKNWLVPTIAVAAVFFLMLLIIPSFLNERNVTIEDPNAELKMERVADDATSDEAGIMNTEMAPGINSIFDNNYPIYMSAMQPYEEEFYRNEIVRLAVPVFVNNTEYIIPVTHLGEGADQIERLLSIKDSFTGEAWGLGNFPAFQINSIGEGKDGTLKIDVKKGSLENLSSAEHFIYQQVLLETFSPYTREIDFSSDGEPGVEWGQSGLTRTMNLEEPNLGYYLYESHTGYLFLVPGRAINARGNFLNKDMNFEETLESMKQGDPNLGYLPAINPEFVITDIKEARDVVTISFAEGTIIDDNPFNLAMLEAIMFTARDFGYEFVQFDRVEPTHVGSYYMGDLIEIPRYINFMR